MPEVSSRVSADTIVCLPSVGLQDRRQGHAVEEAPTEHLGPTASAVVSALSCVFLGAGGSLCKSCRAPLQRTAPDQCESCNPGFALSGAKCQPFGCQAGPGPGCDPGICVKVLCPTHYQSQSWLPGKKCRSQSERTAENQCDECNAGYVLNQEVVFAKGLGVGPLLGLLWLGTWPVREVPPGRLHLLQVLVQHWSGTSFLV